MIMPQPRPVYFSEVEPNSTVNHVLMFQISGQRNAMRKSLRGYLQDCSGYAATPAWSHSARQIRDYLGSLWDTVQQSHNTAAAPQQLLTNSGQPRSLEQTLFGIPQSLRSSQSSFSLYAGHVARASLDLVPLNFPRSECVQSPEEIFVGELLDSASGEDLTMKFAPQSASEEQSTLFSMESTSRGFSFQSVPHYTHHNDPLYSDCLSSRSSFRKATSTRDTAAHW
ncbi:hypothetical protein V5799_021913 [Amblyomma americanum]|uniref:Uncharacterized protein n=1 Tax=Amblyomma americanum TaxID=6943 RepID=A0AAQ4FM67_AMBAM